jgi:MoxR-like ATPase
MQEKQVTIGDQTTALPSPFIVMATQNPIEHEGTYPLPEAQLDRFMLMIKVTYPSKAEERQLMDLVTSPVQIEVNPVCSPEEVLGARRVVGQIYIDDKIRDYIVELVQATRDPRAYGLHLLAPLVEFGGSPRATIYLAQAARAHAFLRHRGYVTPEDVKAIGADVLRHRIVLTYEAEAEEVSSEDVIRRVFEHIEVP